MQNHFNDPHLFNYYTEILKALAHPVRLCIVKGLSETGGCNVSKMQACLEVPQSTLSQHLSKLKSVGIVTAERCGTEVIYSIANSKVPKIINLLFNDEGGNSK